MQVRVSVASLRQLFHGCTPEYIASTCHGRCCDAPSRPQGTLITVHRNERAAIEARGGVVGDDGFLVTPERRCTFKTADHLCGLHTTPDKPFGCIASPFTLNSNDCLVVRNRYRLLVCYGAGVPAYEAFGASLRLLFGDAQAAQLADQAATTTERFLYADMADVSYAMLHENDAAKHPAAAQQMRLM